MKLTVDLGPNSYPIHIENGILAKTGELVSEVFSGKKIMIVSDDNVFPLYGEIITKALSDSGFECHSFVLPHSEPTKSFQSLPFFCICLWFCFAPPLFRCVRNRAEAAWFWMLF